LYKPAYLALLEYSLGYLILAQNEYLDKPSNFNANSST